MIEILSSDGTKSIWPSENNLSLEAMQCIVGGYIEHISAWQTNSAGEIIKPHYRVDLICNEDGLSLGLPTNHQIITRFKEEWGFSERGHRPVGNWIILSGKDRLN